MELPGPRGPIKVERDALGYPTIWARDLNEATWARGYMHATDRLVQIHLVMAAARGELLSIVGERRFARTVDRAVRALGLVTDLDEQVQKLRPDTRAWLDVYCEGFNAGARKRGTPALLRLLGREVEIYTPKSVLTVYRLVTFFGLTSMQQTAEMVIAELVARGAPRAAFDALLGDAATGLDLEKLKDLQIGSDYEMLGALPIAGSNAFAISSKVSKTGGALLMGEFHMEVGRIPPVLYASHVQYADGRFYQGMGIPGFAWNSAGRTEKIAWSYTFGHADNVDIVAERCQDEKREVAGGWEPLAKRIEKVRVKGKKAPETWTFYDSVYGTVLGDASKPGTYPCMRWSGRGELYADLDTTLDSMTTQNVAECIAVQRRFNMLSLQAVFADTEGTIGEVHLGRVDKRPHDWTGAYPYPGWELDGTAPLADDDMRPPATHGVDRIVSANNRAPGKAGARWATLPEPHDRFDRITALLEHVDDADGMVRVSYDAFDNSAARLCEVWGPHLPSEPEARALVEWSKTQRDRSRLGLFHALHLEASRALLERWMGEREAVRIAFDLCAVLLFQFHLDRVLALEKPELLDANGLQRLLARAWPRAKKSPARAALPIVRRFSDPITQGKLGGALGLSSKPVMFPGAPCAPFQTRSFRFEDEALVFGPAFHYLTDMSRKGGWYHLPGGASERRTGPGYGKGIDLWAQGRFLPLGPKDGTPPRPPRT